MIAAGAALFAAVQLAMVGVDATPAQAVTIASPSVAVARDSDGRLEAFATNVSGNVVHRSQVRAGSDTWTPWSPLDGTMTHVAAETNADGRIELWAIGDIGAGGLVYHRWQTSPGSSSWTAWEQMDGSLRSIALARNSDGRLEVWGTDANNAVYHRSQTGANADSWTPWAQVAGSLSEVAAEADSNGRIEVWGTDPGGGVFHATQTAANASTWSDFARMDGSMRHIALGLNGDGLLEVFGTVADHDAVMYRSQIQPGENNWSGWSSLGNMTETSGLAAEANTTGRIDLLDVQLVGITSAIMSHRVQTGTDWTPWVTFDANHNVPPLLAKPVPSGTSVQLGWTDKSDNETQFRVYRRSGPSLQLITTVTSGDQGGIGATYTYTDTTPASDANQRCYEVFGISNTASFASADVCVGNNGDAFGPIAVPTVGRLAATATDVTVNWTDQSNNETQFRVEKRNLDGGWDIVFNTNTRNAYATGDAYSWTDTETAISGQCYRVSATNANGIASAPETCTVRPDPSRFPQAVGPGTEWMGGALTDVNGGKGDLISLETNKKLYYNPDITGIDLDFEDLNSGNSLTIRAQGGPHLMKGEAVSLAIDGIPLKYGHQTFGIDLAFSGAPVYEWYVIGNSCDANEGTHAGEPIDWGCGVALWNSSAHAYLVHRHELIGPDLAWYTPSGSQPPAGDGGDTPIAQPAPAQAGVERLRVFNCAPARHPVTVWVQDITSGDAFENRGSVAPQFDSTGCVAKDSNPLVFLPVTQHQYQVVVTDPQQAGCGSDDPSNNSCVVDGSTFMGNHAGAIQTDTVGVGTESSPFTFPEASLATVPNLTGVGLSEVAAENAITSADLNVGTVTVVDSTSPGGTVLAQDTPAGTAELKNTPVNITVARAAALNVAPVSDLNTIQGVAKTITLAATGGIQPYRWSVTGLPAGTAATTAGVISGAPTVNGVFHVAYTVTDGVGETASGSFTWTIPKPGYSIALSLSSATVIPGGSVSTDLTLTAVNGFTGTVTPTIKNLPAGITASLSPNQVSAQNPTSTLTFTVAADVAADTYTVLIEGNSYQLTVDGGPGGPAGQPSA